MNETAIFTKCDLMYEIKMSTQQLFMYIDREVKKENAKYHTVVMFAFSMN